MYYDILDKERQKILPLLGVFKDQFYLAGGTALALQIGHRDSVDFDFFTEKEIHTLSLFDQIKNVFLEHHIQKIQEEKNTLSIILNQHIKLSFFTYKYPLIKPLIKTENLHIASKEDIACMKLSAILGRSTIKDYVDLYFILQEITLKELLFLADSKFRDTDINVFLKSLVYFEDMEEEPLVFKHHKQISLEKVKSFLIQEVKKLGIRF